MQQQFETQLELKNQENRENERIWDLNQKIQTIDEISRLNSMINYLNNLLNYQKNIELQNIEQQKQNYLIDYTKVAWISKPIQDGQSDRYYSIAPNQNPAQQLFWST